MAEGGGRISEDRKQLPDNPPSAIPVSAGRPLCPDGMFPVLPERSPPVEEKKVRSFREVLVRVMAMQIVTLAVLGYLQYRYGR